MRIKSIHIKSFGKLKNLSLNLYPGLNIIYGSNEAGKSTTQHFIKAMLYGMNSQKKAIRENDRRRFLPWDGGRAEGRLVFEDDSVKEYVIERSFGQTKKEDQSTVYNSITGQKAIHIDSNQPGRDIFGLGEDAFEKTLFIKQLGAKMAMDKEDEIMRRLSNLQQSGEEDISYNKAKAALENYKKGLRGVRKNGKLDDIELNIHDLKQQHQVLQVLHKENLEDSELLNIMSDKIRTLEDVIQSLQGSKKDLNTVLDLSILKGMEAELRSLEEEKSIHKKRLDEVRAKFKLYESFQSLGEDIELKLNSMAMEKSDKEEKLENIALLKSEIKALQERAQYLKNQSQDLEKLFNITALEENNILRLEERVKEINYKLEAAKLKDNKELKEDILKDKKNNSFFLMFAGLALSLALVWGILSGSLPAIFLGAMGLIIAVYGFSQFKKASDKLKEFMASEFVGDDETLLSNEKAVLEEKLKAYYFQYEVRSYSELKNKLDSFRSTISTLEGINMRISDKEEELSRKKEQELVEALSKVNKYYEFLFSHCKCSTMDEFYERFNTYKALRVTLSRLQEQYEKFEAELSNKELEILYKELGVCREQKKDIEHRIDIRFKDKPSLVSLEEELLQSIEAREKGEELYKCADLASKVLEEAFEEVQKDFAPKLNAEVGCIIEKITEGKYNEVRIAAAENYEINVLEQENLRDLEYLSGGTFDQVYFALRMGICNVIFKDKTVPIFLDDTFVQYDEERLETTLDFLKEYSKEHQVIVFTCRKLPSASFINLNDMLL
jgi:uncharacterized protein YhaN